MKHLTRRYFAFVFIFLFVFLPIRVQASAPIIIQGAMACETENMIAALTNPKEERIGPWRFVSGDYQGVPVVVSVTRIGMSNAAASTALGIEHFQPIAVINQGTCGGHDPSLHTFDLVIGADSFDYSAWISQPNMQSASEEEIKFFTYDENDKLNYDIKLPADAKLLKIAKEQAKSYTKGKAVVGTIATANSWNRTPGGIHFLNTEYGSLCEEMETHSSALICKMYNVPFIGLRVLSNTELHGESFNPEAGAFSQEFTLAVVKAYYAALQESQK